MGRDLEIIKTAAFKDELEKLGGVETLAAKLLFRTVPKLLKGLGRGSGATSKFLASSQKRGLGAGQTISRGIDRVSRSWGPKGKLTDYGKLDLSTAATSGAKHRPWFGLKAKAPIKGATEQASRFPGFTESPAAWAKTRPQAWVGEAAANIKFIKDKGIGGFIKHEFAKGRTYTKGGEIYKRSPIGQVMGPALTTGLGFGAMTTAFDTTNPVTGRQYSMGRRLARGATEAAGWSIAPGIMGAKLTAEMGSEAFKALKKKPVQNNNYSFNN